MVYGLTKFREAFADFADNYVIIGGTACDAILQGSPMRPRATDDIDMIVVVENLTEDFVATFWRFIKAGGYKNGKRKRGEGKEPAYEMYRFAEPVAGYPVQIELLARHSDLLGEPSGFHIEPLTPEEERYSLSAIMMDEDLYNFTIKNSIIIDGIRMADASALIALKSKAYLNLIAERDSGRSVNSRDIKKHRNDVLKLAAIINPETKIEVDPSITESITQFVGAMREPQLGSALRDALGVGDEEIADLIEVIENIFISSEQ